MVKRRPEKGKRYTMISLTYKELKAVERLATWTMPLRKALRKKMIRAA